MSADACLSYFHATLTKHLDHKQLKEVYFGLRFHRELRGCHGREVWQSLGDWKAGAGGGEDDISTTKTRQREQNRSRVQLYSPKAHPQ